MADPRFDELARVLVRYSCSLQPGENVLIEAIDVPHTFTRALVRAAAEAGGRPLVSLRSNEVTRDLMLVATPEQMALMGEVEAFGMEKMQAYIGVRGWPNINEWTDISAENMHLYESLFRKPVHHERRVKNTKWVVLRWPSPSMAQLAEMSTEAFEDFYFQVCTLDYAKMSRAMQPLKELMEQTDRVRITGPGTELTFSIKGIPAVPCDGHRNIPDGEVFTAPVRDSIEGTIQFNTPTVYQGTSYDDIRLVFEQGKVVEATSSDTERLNTVLDSDEGARYTGEFALGFNPHITRSMRDILFDEKIAGSLHLTPGQAYDVADNGNRSDIHWDMVLRQTPETGGGEIYFDDRLVRKDGRFVLPALEALNPENLV